jgi:type IV pilus assembly protein PilB
MRKKLGTLLVEGGIITSQQLKFALLEQLRNKRNKRLGQILVELGFAKSEDIDKILSAQPKGEKTNLPAIIQGKSFQPNEIKSTKEKTTPIVSAGIKGETIPLPQAAQISGPKERTISLVNGDSQEEERLFQEILSEETRLHSSYKDMANAPIEESPSFSPVIRMQELVFSKAVKDRASDIHLEPRPDIFQVRFRIDGLLRDIFKIPKWMQDALIARIKILGKMDISERRLPQDGKCRMSLDDKKVDLRISTLPTSFGEKVVLRILDSESTVPSLEETGLEGEDIVTVDAFIQRSMGMILVVGPTGSGKSSTLYALINKLKSEALNIITIEDPIEAQIEGLNQVQVNDRIGLSFASCLRSVLRQDPDVILVGEIRDEETAEIAFKAANTGHLVLSTLHTNSAPATITRLHHLNLEPYLIASSLIGIISQRLIRLNCSRCLESYEPPLDVLIRLQIKQDPSLKFFRGRGCPSCADKAYYGRKGIFQILEMHSKIQELIIKQAEERLIRAAAMERGMRELRDIGLEEAKKGLTTLEEVLRVSYFRNESYRACPKCKKEVENDFLTCPYCEYKFVYQCRACHKPLQSDWFACPYCSNTTPPKEA